MDVEDLNHQITEELMKAKQELTTVCQKGFYMQHLISFDPPCIYKHVLIKKLS